MTTDWIALDACVRAAGEKPRCALKVVIFDESDYIYARRTASRYPQLTTYLQVGNPAPLADSGNADTADFGDLMGRLRWLAARTVEDRWFEVTVLPQLHVLAWGNRRGV